MSTLQKKLTQMLSINRVPKLICLALAILIWVMVEYSYVRDSNEEWNLDNARFSLPE